MATTCIHGYAPEGCLICRTLGGNQTAVASREPSTSRSVVGRRSAPSPEPARPDVVYAPPRLDRRRPRSPGGILLIILMALLAIGAAIWILSAVVFTILHVFELVAVAGGAGWVGYKVGHFRGSRHPRPRG